MTLASWLLVQFTIQFVVMTNEPALWFAIPVFAILTIIAGLFALAELVRSGSLQLLRQRLPAIIIGMAIAALNLAIFGFVKPLLGQITPFTADRALADLDRWLFGTDPWRLLTWMHHPGLPEIYHQGWFIWIGVVFIAVLMREPSPQKTALLTSYFALWSIFGPLVHFLIPAAGPVFWAELGLGDRFAQIPVDGQTALAKSYLWQGFIGKSFNEAGGISAMPSLHLATMGWTVIALWPRKSACFAALLTVYILAASVALGWHYLSDGVVGLALAWVAWKLAVKFFQRRTDA